jgi:MFS family permease
MSSTARAVMLAALSLGVLLVGIELFITAVALPRIIVDLAGWDDLRRVSWVITVYLIAYIATTPLAGRAADRFGLPRLMMGSLALFAIGSLACGAAQTLEQLVVARAVQGVGAGAIVPLATAGASHLYGGHARSRALGVVGAATFLGMAIGPVLGAFVLELFYGIFCWWVYKGGKMLLTVIVLFNVANLSLLSPAVPGPESLLANRPTAIVLVIFAQIVVTLFLIGFYSLRPLPSYLMRRRT